MHKVIAVLVVATALAGCKPQAAASGNGLLPSKVAWRKCLFELDKVEAIRGRNLNDLNRGSAVARNQFLMDCMGAMADELTWEQIDEMSEYAFRSKKSDPALLNLNNGKPRK